MTVSVRFKHVSSVDAEPVEFFNLHGWGLAFHRRVLASLRTARVASRAYGMAYTLFSDPDRQLLCIS